MDERSWFEACHAVDVELEDVVGVECGGRMLAIYRSPQDTFHATQGFCTHERAELADGFVSGEIIECPKHNGRFSYVTGEARRAPACVNLRTYPVKVVDDKVFVDLGGNVQDDLATSADQL